MTGFIASIVEAWGELRVNKGRIMLSLIGVAFSVFALTGVLGAGGMLSSAFEQDLERSMGRSTILSINAVEQAPGAEQEDADEIVLEQIDRLGIEHRSRMTWSSARAQTPQGVAAVDVQGVDPDYATMYRIELEQGRWIADSDHRQLAPPIVVNQVLYDQLGRPDLGEATVTLYGAEGTSDATTATVIGVLAPNPTVDWSPMAYTPAASVGALPGGEDDEMVMTEYLVWVPPESADAVAEQLRSSLRDTPAGSYEAWNSSMSVDDLGFGALQNAVLVVAGVILLLGALGLVNISLVTVRYRVREIGIRRSYGATGLRVFFGVLMESVVATVVAGAVGVAGAIALVKAPFVSGYFRELGLVDVPPFPVSAVVIGLVTATAVGVLAGALPALIATRIRVIDAIRT